MCSTTVAATQRGDGKPMIAQNYQTIHGFRFATHTRTRKAYGSIQYKYLANRMKFEQKNQEIKVSAVEISFLCAYQYE